MKLYELVNAISDKRNIYVSFDSIVPSFQYNCAKAEDFIKGQFFLMNRCKEVSSIFTHEEYEQLFIKLNLNGISYESDNFWNEDMTVRGFTIEEFASRLHKEQKIGFYPLDYMSNFSGTTKELMTSNFYENHKEELVSEILANKDRITVYYGGVVDKGRNYGGVMSRILFDTCSGKSIVVD